MTSKIIDLESPQELERKKLAAEITEHEDFSSLIIENSLDGLITYDREFRYTLWNPAAEKMTGLSRKEALRSGVFDAFPELRNTSREVALRNVLEGKVTFSGEIPIKDKLTGAIRYLVALHSPLRDEAGSVVGGLGVLRDQTEDHWATENIQRLNSALESRVQERTSQLETTIRELRQEIAERLRAESNLKFLTAAGEILAASLNDAQALRYAVELANHHFQGSCNVAIRGLDGEWHELRPFSAGEGAPLNSSLRKALDSIMDTGRSRLLLAEGDDLPDGLHARSAVFAPLLARDHISGILMVRSPERAFTEQDLKTAEEFGGILAMAMENAAQFSRTRSLLK